MQLESRLLQFLACQIPFDPAYSTSAHQPERLELRTGPSKVLNGVVGLNRQEKLAKGVKDIYTPPVSCKYVPICSHLEAIRHVFRRQVDRSFVRSAGAILAQVKCVDGSALVLVFS